MTKLTPQPQPASASSNGCLALTAIVIVIGLIVIFTSKSGSGSNAGSAEPAANTMAASLSSAIATQSKTPVRAFSVGAGSLGAAREVLAISREGLPGAMIYSQNCYDALSRKFSWAKLDECGAFDARAVSAADASAVAAEAKEVAYFQPEAAAGRFLSAATAAGEEAEEADHRWARVQAVQPPSKVRHRGLRAASSRPGVEPETAPADRSGRVLNGTPEN